jgi:hypothetical protein
LLIWVPTRCTVKTAITELLSEGQAATVNGALTLKLQAFTEGDTSTTVKRLTPNTQVCIILW